MNGLSDPILHGNWLLIIDYACTPSYQARIIIQELWRRNLAWDEQIPVDLQQQWLRIAGNVHTSVNEHATLPRKNFSKVLDLKK